MKTTTTTTTTSPVQAWAAKQNYKAKWRRRASQCLFALQWVAVVTVTLAWVAFLTFTIVNLATHP